MTQIKRQAFGMMSPEGGESVGQQIRIEFRPQGEKSYVTVEKSDAVHVSYTRLFWRDGLTEEEGEAVYTQTVEAFRIICRGSRLQWGKETARMVNEKVG